MECDDLTEAEDQPEYDDDQAEDEESTLIGASIDATTQSHLCGFFFGNRKRFCGHRHLAVHSVERVIQSWMRSV